MVRGLPKPTDPIAEKKQYILLMLLDSYEAHAGDLDDATTFGALVPTGDAAEGFGQDVEAMFGVTPSPGEAVTAIVDRIYAAQHDQVLTGKDFAE